MERELVKQLLTKYELTFSFVMTRLKSALGLTTDSDLCSALGMSTSNYANRKRSESIPFEVIIPLAISRSVSLDWLLTGQGTSHLDGRPKTLAPYPPIDILTIGDVAVELARIAVKDRRDSQSYLREARKMAQWAAVIYNKVAPVKDRDEQIALIRADLELLAAVDAASTGREFSGLAERGNEAALAKLKEGHALNTAKHGVDVNVAVTRPFSGAARKAARKTAKR